VGGSYGYFLSKYDWKQHMFEQAVRWGYMFIQEGDWVGGSCRGVACRVAPPLVTSTSTFACRVVTVRALQVLRWIFR
jgi:hypothetical protein